MSEPGVTELLFLLDHTFDADGEHSLIGNLRNVRDSDWRTVPPGGERTIAAIATHAGVAMRLYAEHLCGEATSTYDSVLAEVQARVDLASKATAIDWLRECHGLMHTAVESLADADLAATGRVHWGGHRPKRRQAATIIAHNAYHAGEINHLRAMLQRDDGWFSDRAAGQDER